MAIVDDNIRSFLSEATQELFYNFVCHRHLEDDDLSLHIEVLCEDFKRQSQHEPMEFFGLGNLTTLDLFGFLETSPGFVVDDREMMIDSGHVWKHYNTHEITFGSSTTIGDYRASLLVHACRLLASGKFYHDSCSGNTVLHLVAALPGSKEDDVTLLRYLVQAGLVDPLWSNKTGINILHVMAARLEAKVCINEEDGTSYFGFTGGYIDPECWEIGYREKALDVLSDKFSPEQLGRLMMQPGRYGNTVIHEWVLSTSSSQWQGILFTQELQIAIKLLDFANNLWLQNQSGLFPLHLASNSTVFKFLLERGACPRVTNGRNETAFFHILKYVVALAFVGGPHFHEIETYLFKKNLCLKQSVTESVVVLGHLVTIVNENADVQSTLWIPDIQDIFPLELIAVTIRCASYYVDAPYSDISYLRDLRNMRDYLVALLYVIVQTARTQGLNHVNKNGQNVLHVLLSMDSNTIYDDSALLQSLQILMDNGVQLNSPDSSGKTVFDIVQGHADKMPLFAKKCIYVIQKRAQGVSSTWSSPTSRTSLPSTSAHKPDQATSTQPPSFHTTKPMERKIRSCPRYHYDVVRQLAKSSDTDVTVVDKYRYLKENPIGAGAFSSIYVTIKDEHVDSQSATIDCRAYALKRLEKGKVRPQEIKREVQALLSVSRNCENILNCYESFEDEFFHYLCLDLMDGDLQHFSKNPTAKAIMQQKRTTPAKAVQEIINGLVFLHLHNFLHRDLKPGNILYTIEPSLNFKIGDFGLAKDVSSLTAMTSCMGGAAMAPGTRCWMAPELISLQSREHTKESDVFALGLVLHYLLTFGKHPFGGDEPTHVIEKKIVKMKVSIHGSIPNDASGFLKALLQKEPQKRPPVQYLVHHPFLWSERKKIDFLIAVGDQQEAANPNLHANSPLEQGLSKTNIAYHFAHITWDRSFPELYLECTKAWKVKRYRTNNVLDLTRFIRNAYAHREERSARMKLLLDNYVFLTAFPSLVMEILDVVQALNYDEKRSNIKQALQMT